MVYHTLLHRHWHCEASTMSSGLMHRASDADNALHPLAFVLFFVLPARLASPTAFGGVWKRGIARLRLYSLISQQTVATTAPPPACKLRSRAPSVYLNKVNYFSQGYLKLQIRDGLHASGGGGPSWALVVLEVPGRNTLWQSHRPEVHPALGGLGTSSRRWTVNGKRQFTSTPCC